MPNHLTEQQAERLVRLRWACRRTLKELDPILLHFLSERYQILSMAEQFAFERLLSAADQDILDWIKGKREPRDQGIQALLPLLVLGQGPAKP